MAQFTIPVTCYLKRHLNNKKETSTQMYTPFYFGLINNTDNMRISGTEPSSVILKPHSYGENLLTCANLHMSKFAHVS